MRLAAAVACSLVPHLAHADPVRIATATLEPPVAPPGAVMPIADAPVDPAIATSIARRSATPGASRGLAVGTALTVPEGKLEVAFRMVSPFVGGVNVNAGLTKTTEVWAEGALTFSRDDDDGKLLGAGAKQVLGRGERWQLAAVGSVRHIELDNDDDGQLASLGGVVTVCGPDCTMMLSAGGALLFIEDEDTIPMGTLGLSIGTSTRFFTELAMAGNADDRLSVLMLGMRFAGKKLAFDVGLFRFLGDDKFPALPMMSLVVRP